MIDTAAAMLTFFIAYFKLIVLFCLVASIIAMAEATPASQSHRIEATRQ